MIICRKQIAQLYNVSFKDSILHNISHLFRMEVKTKSHTSVITAFSGEAAGSGSGSILEKTDVATALVLYPHIYKNNLETFVTRFSKKFLLYGFRHLPKKSLSIYKNIFTAFVTRFLIFFQNIFLKLF